MHLKTLSYHVPPDKNDTSSNNTLLKWDRPRRPDGVVILAILKNDPNDPSKDDTVCVKQFCPPGDAYTIELPARLIDPNEDPAVAATREFNEETGYLGKVVNVIPTSYLSPGLTNKSACRVRLEVDMTIKTNIKVHNNQIQNQALGKSEKDSGLEKFSLSRVRLLGALHDLQNKEGVKVFAALSLLALGTSVGESRNECEIMKCCEEFLRHLIVAFLISLSNYSRCSNSTLAVLFMLILNSMGEKP